VEKFKIFIKKSAQKEIRNLSKHDLKAILKKLKVLANNPRPFGCKKLSSKEWYRIRCARYRIIYIIEEDILTIFVLKVAHRKDVYRLN